MRVLIADDHPMIRRGLVQTLQAYPDITVCGEAKDSAEALALALDVKADVLILDLAMPGRGGLEVLGEIRQRCPALPVLVLSMFAEHQFASRALRSGASGYVTKDAGDLTIVAALRKVASGGTYVSAELAEQLAKRLHRRPSDDDVSSLLSERELQVLRLIASGRLVTEIATELSLSVKTVSTYRHRTLEKLGARTTADLVRFAVAKGLA